MHSRALLRALVGAGVAALLAAATHAQAASRAVGPGSTDDPGWSRRDGMSMSTATTAAVDRAIRSSTNRRAARMLAPGAVTIPVRAHIIEGTRRGERHVTVAGIRRQITVLNQAYSGQQAVGRTPDANSGPTADTSFRFALRGVTKTRNETWFHISQPGRTANQMKKALHQGRQYTLNVYFVQPSRSSGLLGYATFPYQYRAHPQLDGLVISTQSLPGGSLTHYNLGNTAVHEIGHWLGLRHVFNDNALGGVDDPDPADCVDNDGLTDTPVEAYPTTGDPVGKDSCVQDAEHPQWVGLDPIHNFMDYSWDEAMYQFTPDQSTTMDLNWSKYRAPSAAS